MASSNPFEDRQPSVSVKPSRGCRACAARVRLSGFNGYGANAPERFEVRRNFGLQGAARVFHRDFFEDCALVAFDFYDEAMASKCLSDGRGSGSSNRCP